MYHAIHSTHMHILKLGPTLYNYVDMSERLSSVETELTTLFQEVDHCQTRHLKTVGMQKDGECGVSVCVCVCERAYVPVRVYA